MTVVSTTGALSEAQLAFAGLHQLLLPLLDGLDLLPEPQRRALEAAFGMAEGDAPDLFLIGLAALGLIAEGAADRFQAIDGNPSLRTAWPAERQRHALLEMSRMAI